jgi:hypothetical protein
MTTNEPRRFYFQIPTANVYDWVVATGFTEAKQIAHQQWGHYYHELQWLTPDRHSQVKLPSF